MEEQKEEWKKLLEDREALEAIELETFEKQFKPLMEHLIKAEGINYKDDEIADGTTMLYCAVCCERWDIVRLLLDHGADINISEKYYGRTALMFASVYEQNDGVKLLLEHGADINIGNEDGRTALMLAAEYGNNDIVKLLLEKGADITIVDKDGLTALTIAIENGQNDIVKLLLEHGVDITIVDKDGLTALTFAIQKGQNDIVKLLLDKGADFRFVDKDGLTAVMHAFLYKNNDIVKLLLEKDGKTALTWAIEEQKNVWKKLLEKSYDWRDWRCKMQIDFEHFKKQFKPLMELPNKVEGINYKDDEIANGSTMLMRAIHCDRWDIARLLVEHGADVNIANNFGNTALYSASASGHTDTVKLFIDMGADFRIENEDGKTPFMIATEYGRNETALLLQLAADPYQCNNNGQSFLHQACLQNIKPIAQHALDVGLDTDNFDNDEHTPLFYAAENGFADIVDMLMMWNADVDKTDERRLLEDYDEEGDGWEFYSVKDGRTPLFAAAQNGHQNIVASLLRHGANPWLCNHESKFPRDVSKNHDAIQQLFRIHDFFDKREKGDEYKERYYTCKNDKHETDLRKPDIPPLQDIIHDIVKYPHYADKFLELYQENREIVNWLDKEDRTVEQVACKQCREVILFMGRFHLDDQPVYESPTCKIYNALDYGGPEEDLKQPRSVAMKFIRELEHFLNEMRSRRNEEDGSPRFSSDFVTPDLAAYRADENEEYAKALKIWKQVKQGMETDADAEVLSDHAHLLVMPQAQRSLLESINAENLSAKHKDLKRREILLTLCKIFSYLHGVGYVHGDIKPHNVVRHMDGGNVTWKAIDFDACTKIGETIGLKLTTGIAPPEMLKIIKGEETDKEATEGMSKIVLRQPGTTDGLDESELVKADPSFDVWSFGVLLYQLVTGRSFFHCDVQGNLDDAGLQDLANLTMGDIHEKLQRVEDVNARVLLSKILHLDPEKRPTMAEIEQDYYFHPSDSPQGRQAEFFHKNPSPTITLEANEATTEAKDDDKFQDLKRFVSSRSDFSYFNMRDEDKDWSDQLLKSEVETFHFDKLEGMGEKPKFIDGDTIYHNEFLRGLLSKKGPDYFMGFLVEYFELYKIMSDAHDACQGIKANLVSDVKSLKGIFIKLFVRGKGLNDIVRGTLFCNSVDLFKYVGTQLKEKYGHNVYIKPPKRQPGAWPIPKLLIYSKNRIDGRCMSVEIQFSTVYMHLALHASNSHVVYEAMRESTDYLDDKDEEFRGFLKLLNEEYIDTEGFLRNESAQEEGQFEILVEKVDDKNESDKTHTIQESIEQYTTKATGLILSGRVRCGDHKFEFLRSEDGYQKFSESSFVVNKSLTLLSSHSYWSEESYDLNGKSVEFVVSFKGRGLAIAGIGTSKCIQGTTESNGGGERCSVHVGRSKFVVRKNGVEKLFQPKKLPNQDRAKIVFTMKEGTLLVSFIVGSSEKDEGEKEIAESQVSMPLNQRYYLYMRAPPGVHDVKFHEVNIK